MEDIIENLKSNNKYFWFISKGKKLSLISQGKKKSEAKLNFKNKLSLKLEKYVDTLIITAKIDIPKKQNDFIGGPIGILIDFKKVNKDGKIVNYDDIRSNIIWFTEDYLLENGFNSKYMINLLSAVYFDKIKLPPIGVILYENLNL